MNLIWVPPDRVPAPRLPAALRIDNQVDARIAMTRGVILFPALLTPLVYVKGKDDPWLELLIACEKTLTAEMVNVQLKVSTGLEAGKPYDPEPLFGGTAGTIVVENKKAPKIDKDEIFATTNGRFSGILHESVVKALKKKGMKKVYQVLVSARCLPEVSPAEPRFCSSRADQPVSYLTPQLQNCSRPLKPALFGRELQDQIIRDMLISRHGEQSVIAGRGLYSFKMKGSTVDILDSDPDEPIVSFHPVFEFSDDAAFDYANFGHASDIHMNSRWQILGKSPARVIEYPAGSAHAAESPQIGRLVAETNRSVHDVLTRLCASSAHVILIGGDVIDHIRNAYWPGMAWNDAPTARDIWNAMDLREANLSEITYPAGTDLVAFYSFILHFCRTARKPFFAVTGNHDCYLEPYGISPRILNNRANEGIPADLNLTFYEALLAFGPSSGWLANRLSSSFTSSWFEWFHTVFTPFTDYSHRLPTQSLVGLGWGSGEGIADLPSGEQGTTHLPRAKEAIGEAPFELLEQATVTGAERPVIVFSHFTLLSYKEHLEAFPGGTAGAPGTLNQDYTRWRMGTFKDRRDEFLRLLGTLNRIQILMTGHSHRRGLYLLRPETQDAFQSFLYDTGPKSGIGAGRGVLLSDLPKGSPPIAPAIICSDSAGPYPKYNRTGEFNGWGGDRPAGTLVEVNPEDGRLHRVSAIQAAGRPPPRAAVALDYFDILENGVFRHNSMECEPVSPFDLVRELDFLDGVIFTIRAELTDELRVRRRISLDEFIVSGQLEPGGAWTHIPLKNRQDDPEAWEVPPEHSNEFRLWARFLTTNSRFVSLRFRSGDDFLGTHYDWKSLWHFEVTALPMEIPGFGHQKVIFISRPASRTLEGRLMDERWPEIPNYRYRMENLPGYGPPPAP